MGVSKLKKLKHAAQEGAVPIGVDVELGRALYDLSAQRVPPL